MQQNPAQELKKKSDAVKALNKKYFAKLKAKPPKDLDKLFHKLHDEAFEQIDCLTCANCCKTTGPLFTQKDIERLAAHFRIKPALFIDRYLRIDEDNDYVLKSVPCPFLGSDNYCTVYEYRPNACREYPHTNQRKMHTILKETEANVSVCPAVYQIVERLKQIAQ